MDVRVPSELAGRRLDRLLATALPGLGRGGVRRLLDAGLVWVVAEGARSRPARKGERVAEGEIIRVELAPEAASGAALPDPGAALSVVLETSALVVADKPAGQPTAPVAPGERGTLAGALLARYPEMAGVGFSPREPGLCHRLDTGTSGLVLAARSPAAFARLTTALRAGKIDKRYLLVCPAAGLPERGTIDLPLAPWPGDKRRVRAVAAEAGADPGAGRPAATRYRVLRRAGALALCEASAPRAARHQIRAHFAAIGHPIAGDALYGSAASVSLGRQALHASLIEFAGDDCVPAFVARSELPAELAELVA
ncbi:MAG: RluA family pseudouridine synthase [Deltaproteobacteria bacterium]|nr:RluA family pseudouridine synthase [Deltaproteobacteria bacterium]